MSARRGLQPAIVRASLLCLCTGTAIAGVVVLNDPSSDARQVAKSRAFEVRKKVLLKALTRRAELLKKDKWAHSDGNAEQHSQRPGEEGTPVVLEAQGSSYENSKNRFFVVTGPDELTLSATEHLSRYVTYSSYNSACRYDMSQRLVVPYGCRLGTGHFARLVEDQLLQLERHRAAHTRPYNDDDQTASSSAAWGSRPQFQQQVRVGDGDHQSSPSPAISPLSSTKAQLSSHQVSETTIKTTAAAAAKGSIRLCSRWDSLLLEATRIVMDTHQLDQAALWSLECALFLSSRTSSDRPYPSLTSEEEAQWETGKYDVVRVTEEQARPTAQQAADARATGSSRAFESDEGTTNVDSTAVDSTAGQCSTIPMAGSGFCLEIVPSDGSRENVEITGNDSQAKRQEEHSLGRWQAQHGLCRELVRWGWGLVQRGLGHVILASPNPWVLAELKEILLEEECETRVVPLSHSEAGSGKDSAAAAAAAAAVDAVNTGTPVAATNSSSKGKASDDITREANESKTLVLVRVALPSAEEREQAVRSVAEELRLKTRLTATEVVMLADLTGGRRSALEDVLLRIRDSSAVTVAEACHATVDDKALTLAMAWGLVSPISSSNLPEKHASRSATTISSSSIPSSEEHGGSAGVSSVLGGFGGARNGLGDQEWAALWEAMGILSLPKVTVGAGPSPMTQVVPEGAMPPGQLLEACDMDADVLLKLTREGWLEVSPAAPPGSGTALQNPGDWEPKELKPEQATGVSTGTEDARVIQPSSGYDSPDIYSTEHHRQPQQKHGRMSRCHPDQTVNIAIVPLKALARLENSFVGAAPLILAAFRRLIDLAINPRADPATPATAAGKLGGGIEIGLADSGDRGGLVVGIGEHTLSGVSRVSAGVAGSRQDTISEVVLGGSEASGGDRRRHGSELERAGCLIQATVLGSLCRREEGKLTEDGNVLSWTWAELDKARKLLQRDGKGDDMSEGEWAEVQLELIRQERAVVATAQEMKTRRARLHNVWREALALEDRAATPSSLSPSTIAPPTEDRYPRPLIGELPAIPPTGPGYENTHQSVVRDGLFFAGAEEAVLSDAEQGVRLMPLRVDNFVDEEADVGGRDGAKGGVGGYGGKLWRWLRRL